MNLSSSPRLELGRRAPGTGGFTLLEVLLAVTLAVVLLGWSSAMWHMSMSARVAAEAKRVGLTSAHGRLIQFQKGELYADVFTYSPGSTQTHANLLAELPGGFPIIGGEEEVSIAADGLSATLRIRTEIECGRTTPVKIDLQATRYR